MRILNITRDTVAADECQTADTFMKRFIGLMGKTGLTEGAGLIITPCNSIHTFFMKFPIDVIFIDKKNTVVYLLNNIKPWKFSRIIWNAHSVIELPSGSIERSRSRIGDIFTFTG